MRVYELRALITPVVAIKPAFALWYSWIDTMCHQVGRVPRVVLPAREECRKVWGRRGWGAGGGG